MNDTLKEILFETNNVSEEDLLEPTEVDSSDEDQMKELDLQILKQFQLRKQKLDKVRQHHTATRKLNKFPTDFTNESISRNVEDNFTDEENTTLSKIRYDIHKYITKLIKKKKLQRVNEIPITFSNYSDSHVSQAILARIQGELISRGFGCEISAERVHTVKYKSRGVILNLSLAF